MIMNTLYILYIYYTIYILYIHYTIYLLYCNILYIDVCIFYKFFLVYAWHEHSLLVASNTVDSCNLTRHFQQRPNPKRFYAVGSSIGGIHWAETQDYRRAQ